MIFVGTFSFLTLNLSLYSVQLFIRSADNCIKKEIYLIEIKFKSISTFYILHDIDIHTLFCPKCQIF
jgi:hypothetical protein